MKNARQHSSSITQAVNLGGEKDYTFSLSRAEQKVAVEQHTLPCFFVPAKHLATSCAGIMDAAELLFCKAKAADSPTRGLPHVPRIYRDDIVMRTKTKTWRMWTKMERKMEESLTSPRGGGDFGPETPPPPPPPPPHTPAPIVNP